MNLQSLSEPFRIGETGYVRLSRIMCDITETGDVTPINDLATVNDARASFAKSSTALGPAEHRLLETLQEGEHTSPFRGSVLQVEVCAPLMVVRQWYKYAIGSDHDETIARRDPFFAWNEVSRRYVTRTPTMYRPGVEGWRAAPDTRRQGSAGPLNPTLAKQWDDRLFWYQEKGVSLYEQAIADGVAPEQARLFLAAYGLYVTFRWTFSLQAGCHVVNQRLNHDAQSEFQAYARPLYTILTELFPAAAAALITAEPPE